MEQCLVKYEDMYEVEAAKIWAQIILEKGEEEEDDDEEEPEMVNEALEDDETTHVDETSHGTKVIGDCSVADANTVSDLPPPLPLRPILFVLDCLSF